MFKDFKFWAVLYSICIFLQTYDVPAIENFPSTRSIKRVEMQLIKRGAVETISFEKLKDRLVARHFGFRVQNDVGTVGSRQLDMSDLTDTMNTLVDSFSDITKNRTISSELTAIDVNKNILIVLVVSYDSGQHSQLILRDTEQALSEKIEHDYKVKEILGKLLISEFPKFRVSEFEGLVRRESTEGGRGIINGPRDDTKR